MHLPIVLLAVVVVVLFLVPAISSQPPPPPPPPEDCERSCGNVSIPFPFGLTERCSYDSSFLVTCESGGPKIVLFYENIDIVNINTNTSELEAMAIVAYDCSNSSYSATFETNGSFSISKKNRLFAVGCNISGDTDNTSCDSVCNYDSMRNGSCLAGNGCCEAKLPKGITGFFISTYRSVGMDRNELDKNPCSYAFVVEQGKYEFSTTDLLDFQGTKRNYPMTWLLDWAIGNDTCAMVDQESDDFLCKGNSECIQEFVGRGYRCRCKQGYSGNPYLKDNCINIDECKVGTHNCKGECIDAPGNYTCPCPNGKPGEYRKDVNTCSADELPIIQIFVGTLVAGLFLILLFTWIYVGLKRRKSLILREKFFKENGGIMLQQKISRDEGPQIQAKLFTVKELEKATNNYDQSRIIGKGGFGTVFKGYLPGDRIVAIKMSKIVDQTQTQVEQFINEVFILSQINHRNVVKLIGCCLETEVPSLVYEFIPNGTLFDHLHNECKSKAINWDIRLRIATETAGALSHLHSGVSVPIIHRDVKTMNILLDSSYVAKVADFGASRLIPMNQDKLATMVQGTLGYLDPEYFQTGQLTEKSDVYSFGVVLVELLTGKKIVDFNKPENERQITKSFLASLENETLFQVLDEKLQLNEVPDHEIILVSMLAKRCLHLKGNERPTMKEVASELERISAPSVIDKHPSVTSTSKEEETTCLLNGASGDYEDIDGTDTSSLEFHSMKASLPK
uniref:wall-associated receptor kinase 2-like n=1 Tax=Erigeron canadensis TaxID=72917 RepID=UPI001CB9C504|nr:wall-associated receptor kinase 2-like [Erigeron canadensis]